MYSIRLYEDGSVVYCGEGDVLARGYLTARISSKSVDSIRGAFRSIDFLRFTYQCEHGEDAPGAFVFYREAGRARLIYDSSCHPDTHGLAPLEDSIDAIVDSKRWIGEDGHHERQRRARLPFGHCEPLTVPGVPVEDGHRIETGEDLLTP